MVNLPGSRSAGDRWARLWRVGSLAFAVGGIAVLASACGGGGAAPGVASLGTPTTVAAATGNSGNATSDGTPPGATGDPGAKAERYAACMRHNGVPNFPSPQVSANGGSVSIRIGPGAGVNPKSPQFQSANAKCRSLLPFKGAGPSISSADQLDYLKAAQCMRSHGIAGFPDPTFAHGSVNFPIPRGMSTTSTQFDNARLTCEKLIPAGLPYSN